MSPAEAILQIIEESERATTLIRLAENPNITEIERLKAHLELREIEVHSLKRLVVMAGGVSPTEAMSLSNSDLHSQFNRIVAKLIAFTH